MAERHTFVLVHGAWRDARTWTGVAERLRAAGHEVHTPTIAGHGPGAAPVGLDRAVAGLVEFVEARELTDVVLVGHSLGGLYVSLAVPRLLARLRRVVYLVAFVPSHGRTLYDLMPDPAVAYFRAATVDGAITQSFERVHRLYLSTMVVAAARESYTQMSPQHVGPFDTVVDTTAFDTVLRSGRLPVSYIDVTGDRAMGPAGWYAAFADRLGPVRLVRVHGQSHEITWTAPGPAADAIVEAADGGR